MISKLREEMKSGGIGGGGLGEEERDVLEARIRELESEMENKSGEDKDTSSLGDMELRIKTLLIENRHMQENYQK